VKTDLFLQDPDGFYERWMDAHQGLDLEKSFELNARLIMLLANQIGDPETLELCIGAAQHGAGTILST
jgi:hypothetical protein